MQKKKVRIYKPKFQDGGAPMMNPGMMGDVMNPAAGSADQGQTTQEILTRYAQISGMSQEETLNLINEFSKLGPEEQQSTLVQITDKLRNATQTPVEPFKKGGKINETKKLIHKAIGGAAGQNMTADNVVGNRKQQIMNAIGANVARNYVDETYKEAQEANTIQTYNPMMQQAFQMGGGTGFGSAFYGGMDPNDNPYLLDYETRQANAEKTRKNFGKSILNIGNVLDYAGTKVKVRGDMFGKQTPYVSTDPNKLTSNEAAETMFGLKYGGSLPKAAYGMSVDDDTDTSSDVTVPTGMIDIGTGYYDPATKTITGTDGTSRPVEDDEANWIMSQTQFGNSSADQTTTDGTATDDTSTTVADDTDTGGFFTGVQGDYIFKDGKIVGTVGGAQNSILNLAEGNYMFGNRGPIFTQEGAKQFAQSLQAIQPENVYMDKFKARTGPFGNKVKMTWDYGDGTEQANENLFDRAKGMFTGRGESEEPTPVMGSNFINRLRAKAFANSSPERQARVADRQQRREDRRDFRRFGTVDNSTANMFQGELPEEAVNPERNLFEQKTKPMAIGGRAGKLVIKDKYSAPGLAYAGALLSGMNALAAGKEKVSEDESMYDVNRTMPVLMDSRERNPLSRGLWGTGALIGEETPDLQPANYGYRFSQGSGNLLSGQSGYSPYGKNGGTYQTGGLVGEFAGNYQEGNNYYLDDNETQDMFKRGGKVFQDGGLYDLALQERQYFLNNPDMWESDPDMKNEDGSFNLCVDCLNVDYSNPEHVRDVARLINEGYSKGTHYNADAFNQGLTTYGIATPVFGSAKQQMPTNKKGGSTFSYRKGGVYYLNDDQVKNILKNGGSIEYI
jgi:hypothetical protein